VRECDTRCCGVAGRARLHGHCRVCARAALLGARLSCALRLSARRSINLFSKRSVSGRGQRQRQRRTLPCAQRQRPFCVLRGPRRAPCARAAGARGFCRQTARAMPAPRMCQRATSPWCCAAAVPACAWLCAGWARALRGKRWWLGGGRLSRRCVCVCVKCPVAVSCLSRLRTSNLCEDWVASQVVRWLGGGVCRARG
jgi:hypothetical protein